VSGAPPGAGATMSGRSSLQGLSALVTGGAGFIGSHLVDELLHVGVSVRVLDDLSNGKRENLAHCLDRIEFVVGDIRDVEVCRGVCQGADLVFHQAALGSVPRSMKDPATSLAVNVSGTANVFAAARDASVRRVVYASSSSVYGDSTRLPKREGEEGRPLSPYALSKAMDEELAATFQGCYGMELVGLRYFNVYGPRQDPDGPYAAVIPRFFKAYLAGEAPVIYGDGAQTRDFTFVADAVEANVLAATAPASACGTSYNVAGGNRTSVSELAAAVRDVVGGGPEPRHESPRPGDVPHSAASLERSSRELGYAPRVNLTEGLTLSLDHYRALVAGGVSR
jgi:nucleoside-diphosphate-sugar epimerase